MYCISEAGVDMAITVVHNANLHMQICRYLEFNSFFSKPDASYVLCLMLVKRF